MSSDAIKVLFFGTPAFSVPALKALLNAPERFKVVGVVTQPDRKAGRGGNVKPSPIKEVAVEAGIKVFQPTSLRKEIAQYISDFGSLGSIDLGVVVAFGQILPKEILDLPKAGCVNVHASLLPRWRGAAPIQRSIMSGDKETGVAIMKMEAGLDTGPVFSTVKLPILPEDTSGTLHDKLSALGAECLVKVIPEIVSGDLAPIPQDQAGILYADKITETEAQIDWSKPAKEIDWKIRGLSPFPGAFTTLNGQRLKVYHSTPHPSHSNGTAPPGSVVYLDNRRLEVQCGEGVLTLNEVQLEGRKRLQIEEFLRGFPLTSTTKLG